VITGMGGIGAAAGPLIGAMLLPTSSVREAVDAPS
jgi:hypothetical protein